MEAYVTFATTDSYALGALVLAASLRRVNTAKKLHILITNGVTQSMREQLANGFDGVTMVDLMDSKDLCNLRLMDRPDLGCTFTKLHCWRLTQYTKCVFLDADTLVVQPVDELFERDEFSAAADIGWPDCFNSGVFVFVPSTATYDAIIKLALEEGSFDGGDQGVLNSYFSGWRASDVSKRLPFTYNMSSSLAYTYKAAHKHFIDGVKIIHYLGAIKPWNHAIDASGNVLYRPDSMHGRDHVTQWWNVYSQDVRDVAKEQFEQLVGAPSRSTYHPTGVVSAELAHQRAWEEGNIDYLGKDSFDNIQKVIEESMNK